MCDLICFVLILLFESLQIGFPVIVTGPKSWKALNGKKGIITKFEDGKFEIRDANRDFFDIVPKYLSLDKVICFFCCKGSSHDKLSFS